ncbi:hypothetical protein D3C84_863580 [compost metagenome]
MRFIIIYAQGPDCRENVILHNHPSIPEHAVYGQQHQHLIMLAGPFACGSGGSVVKDIWITNIRCNESWALFNGLIPPAHTTFCPIDQS